MRDFEEYFAFHRYFAAIPERKTGALYLICDLSGQFNLWKYQIGKECPKQVTFFEEKSVGNTAPPVDEYPMILMVDEHGTENHQLYVLEQEGRWPKDLTKNPNARHEFSQKSISLDGRWIAFGSTRDNPKYRNVYLLDRKSLEFYKVMDIEKWLEPGPFSPDGKFLLVMELVDVNTTSIHLLDLTKREHTLLIPHKPESFVEPEAWLPDGSGFFFITNQEHEFNALALYDMTTNKTNYIDTGDYDVEFVKFSYDSNILAWTINDGGHNRLFFQKWYNGTKEEVPLPRGQIWNMFFLPDGNKIAFVFSGARYPFSVWIADLKSKESKMIQGGFLTDISPEEFSEPESITYESFDGLKIQAWVYRPNSSGKAPVVVYPHGGPNWQFRPSYSGTFQYLLDNGIGIFAPNFRGSTGFGKSFMKLINKDWGGGELRDIEEGVKWLLKQDWVDPNRIAVYGGSFGGFATLSCLTRIPQYFCCGVDIMGPSNLITFAKTVPEHWKPLMNTLLGDPEKDHNLLVERSPLTYIDNIKAPLLVIQGANDPRVVKSESDQIVDALRSKGVEVEYIVFDDEGHGFSKRRNMIKAFKSAAEFLIKHLKG